MKTFSLPAAVAHQADPPDLAFERAEAGADFDAEALEQRLADRRVVDALGNPHGVELRQLVARLRGVLDADRGQARP